jgi:polysaccharide export outer membrane protein
VKFASALWFLLAVAALPSAQGQQIPDATSAKPYILGAGDQLSIQVLDVEEFNDGKKVRIDDSGTIILPLAGRTVAAGLTAQELQAAITSKLARDVVKPEVTVTILERRTLPVTVSGAVKSPGPLNIPTDRTLFEVLAMAGGILPDAGYRVRLTRRVSVGEIPVAGTKKDPSGQYYVADISLKGLEEGNSADNIPILSNDFIAVPHAELIYIIGDMKKTGAFALADDQTVSLLQAVAFAEGPLKTAALSKVSIQRVAGDDKRVSIPVDLGKIMKQQAPDVRLQAKDILVVPGSASQSALEKTISTVLAIGTGAVVRLY